MPLLNWLHITDLHHGSPDQEWLWPNCRYLIKEDLRRLSEIAGPWDLVIFTGDLAYSGELDQFSKVIEELSQLWDLFGTLGCNPVLLAIPGNHDLKRPGSSRAIVKTMGRWDSDPQVRDDFYNKSDSEYRVLIDECFAAYSSWWDHQPFPKPVEFTKGLLPGDFVARVEKPGIKVAIAGMNTAFLQLTDDDYLGRLTLHERQIHAACGNDLASWSEKANLSLLVTHHDLSWLGPEAKAHLVAEIYAPGRFDYHFCGHMHTPKSLNTSEGGGPTRRLRQGPSLCGLKTWGKGEQRIHGYIAGRFEFVDSQGTELLWPRLMVRTYAGPWRIGADQGYELDNSGSLSLAFTGRKAIEADTDVKEDAQLRVLLSASREEAPEDPIAAILASGAISFELAKASLQAVPRFRLSPETKHLRIRKEQQAELETILRRHRCGWIVSDWGLGKTGFLSTVLERLSPEMASFEIYRINCEDITTIDDLINATADQFQVPLQQFATFNAVMPNSLLVFDDLSPELSDPTCLNEDHQTLGDIIDLIRDYCPTMYLVVMSRQKPLDSRFAYVELQPLSLPEISTYLSDQPALTRDDIILEQIEMRSGGLPMYLDMLVKKLKVYSLDELLNAELEAYSDSVDAPEPVPKALKAAVDSLAHSTNQYSRRSYRMLKVLSVLPNGALFDSIRRFYATEPFYITNAEELLDFSLIEATPIIPLKSDIAIKGFQGKTKEELAPKLLKVPRQIRDYMRSTMSEQEYSEIIKQAADLFFGDKWREGKVKLHGSLLLGTEESGQGVGNEHVVARHLLWESIQADDVPMMSIAADLCYNYCERLIDFNRFKETCLAAEEIFHLLERTTLKVAAAEMAILFGRALRMIGRRERAIEILESALRIGGDSLSRDSRAFTYLNMALAYGGTGNKSMILENANLVMKLEPKDSAWHIQAQALKLLNEGTSENLDEKLLSIERKARKKGYDIVADNIILDIARTRQKDVKRRAELYDRVLGDSDAYNRVRAIVAKASLVLSNENAGSLNDKDRRLLGEAYSYLFGQRMRSLFNSCHESVWTMLKRENKLAQMLIVFRLSSFLWRIRGEVNEENKYLQDIRKISLDALDRGGMDLRHELSYLKLREEEQNLDEKKEQ